MSGLFAPTPQRVTIPTFLGGAQTAAAPQNAQMLELMSLQQELARIQAELDRLIASLAAPIASPAPGVGIIGQTWQYLTNLFNPQPAPTTPSKPPKPAPGPKGETNFVLSSFNVLSSSAGKGKGYAAGTTRMHAVADILRANKVSVVGFQEVDYNQLNEFKKVAGDEYGTFAGESGKKGYHDAVIAWRKDTWKLVKSGTITVPSYAGRASKVPYVRLINKQTGQEAYFVDAHNPANTKNYHHQERFRDAAARQEAALVNKLRQESGLPVFMVGDMNSVKEAQQIFTSGAPVKAANPKGKAGIDWIFGTKDAKFSNFRRTREGQIQRTTDHPVVFTNVSIGGK